MRAPEDERFRAERRRKLGHRRSDPSGERRPVIGGVEPAIDRDQRPLVPALAADPRELLQARAGGGDRVLRKERQSEERVGGSQVVERILGERRGVAHRHRDLNRGRASGGGHPALELGGEERRLALGPLAQGRPAADARVIAAHFGRSRARDQPGQRTLDPRSPRHRKEVGIGEEPAQKGLDLIQAIGPTELEEEEADARGRRVHGASIASRPCRVAGRPAVASGGRRWRIEHRAC